MVRIGESKEKHLRSKNVIILVLFLAVFFFALVPYISHIVQKQSLDADLGSIMLDYSTIGKEKFRGRVDEICQKAGLKSGTYEIVLEEDPNSKRLTVEIRYDADLSIFFIHRLERVVLRNTTSNLGL